MDSHRQNRGQPVAFLLAQVGAHAAAQFAQRLRPLHLAPAHAGILRLLATSTGLSQRELASALDIHASRLVALIDEMESLGLLLRATSPEDRRTHALHLTEKGKTCLAELSTLAMQHNQALCAALTPQETQLFATFLQRIADQQGLTPGVHPGYKTLPPPTASKPPKTTPRPTKPRKPA